MGFRKYWSIVKKEYPYLTIKDRNALWKKEIPVDHEEPCPVNIGDLIYCKSPKIAKLVVSPPIRKVSQRGSWCYSEWTFNVLAIRQGKYQQTTLAKKITLPHFKLKKFKHISDWIAQNPDANVNENESKETKIPE